MKSEKKTLVPRLRFPEFRESGSWKKRLLGDLFINRQERGYAQLPLLSVTSEDGVIPQQSTNRKKSASADKTRYLRIVPGDIVYNTMRMWQGRSAYVTQEGIVSPAYTVCKPKNDVNGLFYSYYFKNSELIIEFWRYSQGIVSDTLNLKFSAFSEISVACPQPGEQQKIADCLSSLDALISAQADKIDALMIHKKGLMQQLFPREGETVPRLRFPEFHNARAWEEKVLPNVCQINPRRMPMHEQTLVSFVPMSSVSESGQLENPEVRSYGEVKTGYTSFVNNDVIIAKITPCFENGKAAHVQNLINGVGFGSTEFHVFRAKDTCLPQFLFAQLYRESVRSRGADSMIGNAGQRRVPKTFFESLPFFLPSSAEQQAVANCLSALDDHIAAETDRIEALKQHKTGLMQQLFSSSEVTGT